MGEPVLTAKDLNPKILANIAKYGHGRTSRRQFTNRGSTFAAGVAGATRILASLSPNYAHAQGIAADDARISICTRNRRCSL